MAETQSADQVLAKYQEVLGEDFGKTYKALSDELLWMYLKWQQFTKLYRTKEARVILMNETAPFFFRMLQRILWNETLLGITRLVGPRESRGKSNLTVQRLPTYITSSEIRTEVRQLVDVAVARARFASDRRHRIIAHLDLTLATNPSLEPLQPATIDQINVSLSAIQDVLAFIHKRYFNAQFVYDSTIVSGDAESLLSYLREGTEARKERLARIMRGEGTQADYDLRGAP